MLGVGSVSKAALMTSMFALCFLFAQNLSAQSPTPAVGAKSGSTQGASDYETHLGIASPSGVLQQNYSRLDEAKTSQDNALGIVKELLENHDSSFLPSVSDASYEIEFGTRRALLFNFATALKKGTEFSSAFASGMTEMAIQHDRYDSAQYKGPSLEVIAEGYLANFY